ncbi:MAG: hypothetical protein FWC33_02050 [Candidatus Bathyarchaeota archaeon]|nr:hypothetical protein [Candidatus Termiticorpusculum sp.]
MNNRVFAVSAILCIIALMFAGFSQAQPITSGVKGGQVFFYYVSSYWSSPDNFSSISPDLIVVNQTECIEIRIGAINATSVETLSMYYYNDGTVDFERGGIDLYTGIGSGFVGVIGANLKVGDRIHPNGEDTLTILDTTARTYESGARATNYIRIVDDNQTGGYKATRDLYFDKETGILVEQVDQVVTTVYPITTTRLTWKIASVSGVDSWFISGFTFPTPISKSDSGRTTTFYLLIVVPLSLIIAGSAIIVYKKKMVKQK